MAKVSVIIPTHNRAALLGCAIQSVLNQTYLDFELLVVDDGSMDNPEHVVGSFADPRIRFVRHPVAQGGGAARNTGIRNTTGPYVAFLDDDDAWYPEKLALQVSLLNHGSAKIALVYGGYDVTDRGGDQIISTRIPTDRGDLRTRFLTENVIGGTSLILVRRSCLESVGGFDETLPSFQDYDLYLRLSDRYQFDYVPEAVSLYRRHGVQIWKNPIALLGGLEKMLEKHGVHRLFRESLAPHYLRLGRHLCVAGDAAQGRHAIWRSLMLNPKRAKAYGYYGLAFLGPGGFGWASRIKASFARRTPTKSA